MIYGLNILKLEGLKIANFLINIKELSTVYNIYE